jgi:CHAT domain-containing protein/tetratricopeptide (TPR) repeat protein
MRLLAVLFIFLFFLVLSFSQTGIKKENNYRKIYLTADKLFHDAEKLTSQKNYSEEREAEINKQSLSLFQKIIPEITIATDDSLAFLCHFKSGLLYHYFDSLQSAKKEYLAAIALKKNIPAIADSFLFQPYLFTGTIFYRLNKFDSAYIFYKKAEGISEKYSVTLNEEERLYNWLGGMYYETGNYKQAKNYFEKAIILLSPTNSFYRDFLVKYKSNIASSLLKLEKFSEADSIYESILPFKINTNEILQNIGSIKLNQGDAEKAISYFQKVHYNSSLNILLYNKISKAYSAINKPDSAEKYLTLAIDENKKWNGTKKNVRYGLTLQYLAEKYAGENKYKEAINNYQPAIVQFYPDYNDYNPYKNPENFSGVFSYINLFNALTAKADAFEKLYLQDKKTESLGAALNAYRSAFKLADYVEKTYDSDEARLFLNKIKYDIHDRPIHVSLQLYQLTKKKEYLEETYNFDQQNKASILALNVEESLLKNQPGFNSDLFEKESSVKSAITRLSLKATQVTDGVTLNQINGSIRDYEIELGKIQDKKNDLPGYKVKKFANSIPTTAQVQNLLDKETALLSYHLAKNELVILCITSNEMSYYQQAIDTNFFSSIVSFKILLNNFKAEQKYNGAGISAGLYITTIKPVWDKIKNLKKLLIIPDDELNNLPFEALTDETGKYLLEKFTVQYQYSAAFLRGDIKRNIGNKTSLAMAPFSNNGNGDFARLEYSKSEIENPDGNILFDTAATKKRFLDAADKYGILHLATHTIVNDTIPEKSLIAFYPVAGTPSDENNLYVQEIYNLKLDSTNLVILSACETGTGQLAKGEGLMSLARAFTYAGCPNIIASLWKADDKSTAWIIKRFYHHLQNGEDAAAALQKAKLDYIKSPDIEKRFKTPNYWAHLVLTGIPETNSSSIQWPWIVGVAIFLLTALFYISKKRNRKK